MQEDIFQKEIAKEISKALGKEVSSGSLEIPPDKNMGDYAFPCFYLAKEFKKNPIQISKELEEKIKPGKYIGSVKSIGPYVNFFVVKEVLSKKTLSEIFKKKAKYGAGEKKNETVMVESPGPNTNKPLHLGHVRNMLLGNSLVNIYRFLGYKAIRVDIINDRGVHICKSMLAYEKFSKGKKPDKKSDHFVGDFYVKYAKELPNYPQFETDIQDMLKKWEENDRKTRALWKKMTGWALKGFKVTYKRFGTKIDKPYYESDHYTKGKKYVADGLKKGIFEKDEKGNIFFADPDFGKKIVLRADGTAIYITQDIALGKIRYDDYKMDKMIYVVGSEQIHHFKALFKIFERMNFSFAKDCYHMAFGMIYLPEGKMKSREGNVVDADNLADEMHEIARKETEERHKDVKGKLLEKRAEEIGMAAIKFFILKHDAMKDFIFNPKESISFEGETGPYVQYTHARVSSILRNHKGKLSDKIDFSRLNSDEEKTILKLLEEFPTVIKKSANEYKPNFLTRYLLDLSQAFNAYYHRHKIIQEDKELEKARILLAYCVKQVLSTGLGLLGISAPEEM